MIEVHQTAVFRDWLDKLQDRRAQERIAQRIVQRGKALIILLCGGDKRSQQRDIRRAKAMAKEV